MVQVTFRFPDLPDPEDRSMVLRQLLIALAESTFGGGLGLQAGVDSVAGSGAFHPDGIFEAESFRYSVEVVCVSPG